MIASENVKRFCREDISKIENYDKAINDHTQTWHCHHRLEIGDNGERISRKDLKNRCLYFDRPASELIFLTRSEHVRLHHTGNKNMLGKKFSDETRQKMSEAHRGRTMSEESRRKMSEARKGMTFSEETRRKMSEAKRGKPMSEEARRKLSESLKGRKRPPFSEEWKRKLSESHKMKISESHKGSKMSEEQKRKISEAKKGSHHSEETRMKMSLARKAYWEKKKMTRK